MANHAIAERIVDSLSFEVEAVPQDLKSYGASKSTPVNLKVKVRKNDEAPFEQGVVSVPKLGQPKKTPDRVRLVNSDQTVLSFQVFVDTEPEEKPEKKRKKFFGRCLSSEDNNDEPYMETATATKPEEIINRSFGLSKNVQDLQIQTRKPTRFFGNTCKPGGCLDPAFDEEKYSYEPVKRNSEDNKGHPNVVVANKINKTASLDKTASNDVIKIETQMSSKISPQPSRVASKTSFREANESNFNLSKIIDEKNLELQTENIVEVPTPESEKVLTKLYPEGDDTSSFKSKTDSSVQDFKGNEHSLAATVLAVGGPLTVPLLLAGTAAQMKKSREDEANSEKEKGFDSTLITKENKDEKLSASLIKTKSKDDLNSPTTKLDESLSITSVDIIGDNNIIQSEKEATNKLLDSNEVFQTKENDVKDKTLNESTDIAHSGSLTLHVNKYQNDLQDENFTKDTLEKENFTKDDLTNNDPIKYDLSKDDLTKGDHTKDDLAKEYLSMDDLKNNYLAKYDLTNDDVATEDLTKEDITKDDLTSEDVAKDELINPNLNGGNLTTDDQTKDDLTRDGLDANEVLTNDNITRDSITKDNLTNDNLTRDDLINDNFTKDNITVNHLPNDDLTKDDPTVDKVRPANITIAEPQDQPAESLEKHPDNSNLQNKDMNKSINSDMKNGLNEEDNILHNGQDVKYFEDENQVTDRKKDVDLERPQDSNKSNNLNNFDTGKSFDTSGHDNGNSKIDFIDVGKQEMIHEISKIKYKFPSSDSILSAVDNDKAKLKGHTETLLNEPKSKFVLKKDFINMNLAFQSYTNDENESVLKSLGSVKDIKRQPQDNVTIIKSQLKMDTPNKIKVPIDTRNYMMLEVKTGDSQVPSQAVSRAPEEASSRKNENKENFSKVPSQVSQNTNAINKTDLETFQNLLTSVYEKQLIPLQRLIADLKNDVDTLSSEQLWLKENCRKKKPTVKLIHSNRKCGCYRK